MKLNSYAEEFRQLQLSEKVSPVNSEIQLPQGPSVNYNFAAPDSLEKITQMDSIKVFSDSLFTKKDSIVIISEDSLKLLAMSKDSTARLQNYHYVRNPLPVVRLGKTYQPGFVASPTPGTITRSVEIDSTGEFVLIKEEINGLPYKTLLKIPLDEYIEIQLALNQKKVWEQLGAAYELKSSKIELGQLIKDITDFEIPLPSIGVLYFWYSKDKFKDWWRC